MCLLTCSLLTWPVCVRPCAEHRQWPSPIGVTELQCLSRSPLQIPDRDPKISEAQGNEAGASPSDYHPQNAGNSSNASCETVRGLMLDWVLCRFQTTFLGSRGLTGKLVAEGMLEQEDRNGETLSDVLYKHGYQGSEEALARAAYTPEQVRG